MTEETRETCRKLLDKVFNQEYDDMFGSQAASPPWRPNPMPPQDNNVSVKHIQPQTMTMRKFCHHLFKNKQDVMLAIVQSNRKLRRKANASHPYLYTRQHDEAAVAALVKEAQSMGIAITGTPKQQRDSYGEYRAEHLNYKSCVKGNGRKLNIPVIPGNKSTIPTFVSDTKLDDVVQKAAKLTELDAIRKQAAEKAKKIDDEVADDLVRQAEAHRKIKEIEAEQRELIRQLSGG